MHPLLEGRRGDGVLRSREEYQGLQETAHLLRAPKNARRPLESLDQARAGKREELRHVLAGAWSRRITEEHRLVYLAEARSDLRTLMPRGVG